jgi:transposase
MDTYELNTQIRSLPNTVKMGKIKRMDQVKSIIEAYLGTGSIKGTARQLGLSKNTIRGYVRKGLAYNNDLSKVLLLPDAKLLDIFYEAANQKTNARESVFLDKTDYWVKELRRVGVTKHLLWEEYRTEHPKGYGYSQFCEHLKRAIGHKDLTLSMNHIAGEKMQVDFAGKKMSWVDIATGEVHDCEILVAVLPHSQYTFTIALASQKVADFIHGLNQAFVFFGKIPKVILSDNLKSYVTRSDRYEPQFNELCQQLAAHYQLDLQAARVRKPKDKASVENMVRTVYSRIYAPLRNEVFHSIGGLNEAMVTQLHVHNAKPYQNKQGSRKSIFEDFELPVMRDLPPDLFEVKKITKAKVQRNYHVFLGEEKNFYSVPFKYVGKQTTVIYTAKTVEVYLDNQRIAIHDRLPGRDTYMHQTNTSHMPRNHVEWKQAQGYDETYFLEQARKIGPATCWAIGHILVSRIHQVQSYNSCKGVLHLAKKYSDERLELAAARCQTPGKVTYSMLKNILERKLDQQTEQLQLFALPEHENIRGPKAYQ